jgi:pimeloyl-ACP methyl ester carboxylesterase
VVVAGEPKLAHKFATVNGVRLHYVEAGQGPLVLFLHGFPQYWYAWRRQLAAVAAAGFRAVAMDMRGYNLSDKPEGVASYRMEALVGDVAGLVAHLGAERVTLAGHDWGGSVAWAAAMTRPELVERLVVINAPHPAALARELENKNWRLMWRLAYVGLFQLPWLPEAALRAGGFSAIRRVLREEPARRDAFSDEEIECYVAALREPGALTAAINYYRAAVRGGRSGEPRRIDQPTLLIWGDRDAHLGIELTNDLDDWLGRYRFVRLPGVSHWVIEEESDLVTELILESLTGRQAQRAARG